MNIPNTVRKLITAVSFCALALTISGSITTARAAGEPVYSPDAPASFKPETFPRDEIIIRKADGEELRIIADLAVTPSQLEKGLMYRSELGDDQGMLFIFNSERNPYFWMKNTLIPLDMIFIAGDGKIHHIHHNAKPQDTTRIKAEYDSLAILEMAGGAADRLGIREGDTVVYSVFRNSGVQH